MFEENRYLNLVYEPYHLNALGMCHSVLGYIRKVLITFYKMNSRIIFFYNFNAEAFPRTFTRVLVVNKGFHSLLWCIWRCILTFLLRSLKTVSLQLLVTALCQMNLFPFAIFSTLSYTSSEVGCIILTHTRYLLCFFSVLRKYKKWKLMFIICGGWQWNSL